MESILSLGTQRDPPARSWALLPSDLFLLIKRQLLSAHISVPNASGTPSIFPTSNYILGFDVLFLGSQIFLHAEKEESSSKLPRELITKLVKMKEEHLSPLSCASRSFCHDFSVSLSLSLSLSLTLWFSPACLLSPNQAAPSEVHYSLGPPQPGAPQPRQQVTIQGPTQPLILEAAPRWRSGKESACNARDAGHAGSSPGLGRSRGQLCRRSTGQPLG